MPYLTQCRYQLRQLSVPNGAMTTAHQCLTAKIMAANNNAATPSGQSSKRRRATAKQRAVLSVLKASDRFRSALP